MITGLYNDIDALLVTHLEFVHFESHANAPLAIATRIRFFFNFGFCQRNYLAKK